MGYLGASTRYQLSLSATADAPVQPVDTAGSTFDTARDLGTLSSSLAASEAVGPNDVVDFFSFDVTQSGAGQIQLDTPDGTSAVFAVFNDQHQVVNVQTAVDPTYSGALSAGRYYVLVYSPADLSYSLHLTFTADALPSNPSDPPPGVLPDVPNFGGANDWNLNAINAPEAWAAGYTGQGVTVAVIDTGVDLTHPDLQSQLWVNPGEIAGDGIDNDGNGYVDDVHGWDFVDNDAVPDDENMHGTHVSGTIAGANNGTGVTGVAYGANIMAVRVLDATGSGSLADVAAGIRYAVDNGAQIISMSLGATSTSGQMGSALRYAQQHGVLVVAAAGNDGAAQPDWPARYSASLDNVLSIGAYDSSLRHASFSNSVGSSGAAQVDAPGVNVYSSLPDGRYGRLSGTSMATPQVAGLAALALSANPHLTAAQLRTLIVEGANLSVAGSDSAGGVNAAVTVAQALRLGAASASGLAGANSAVGGASSNVRASARSFAVLAAHSGQAAASESSAAWSQAVAANADAAMADYEPHAAEQLLYVPGPTGTRLGLIAGAESDRERHAAVSWARASSSQAPSPTCEIDWAAVGNWA